MKSLLFLLSFIAGIVINNNFFLGIFIMVILTIILLKKDKKIICLSVLFLLSGYFFCYLSNLEFRTNINGPAIVLNSSDNYFIIWYRFKIYYVKDYQNTYNVFDIITIKGTLGRLQNHYIEQQFNFDNYLFTKNITYEVFSSSKSVIYKTPFDRKYIINNCFNHLNEEGKSYVLYSLFNYKTKLFKYSNINMQEAITFTISTFYIRFIEKNIIKNFKHSNFILVVLLILFLIFTNFKFSILRMFLLFLFGLANDHYKLNFSKLDLNNVLALIILFINPNFVYSISFIFTFVLNIYFNFVRSSLMSFNKYIRCFLNYVFVMLFFLPIFMKENFLVNIINLAFRPLIIIVSSFLLVVAILGFFPLFTNFINDFSKVYFNIIRFDYSFFNINVGDISIFYIFIFYFLIFLFLFSNELSLLKIRKISVICLMTILFLPTLPKTNKFLCFIDVGQGDSTLIAYKDENILIDTGGNINYDIAYNCLIPFFNKNKIAKLDYVLTTHLDYDHSGALESLKKHFKVKQILSNKEVNHLNTKYAKIDNLNYNSYGDENECSGVYYISINDKTILIMGDAPKSVETKILNLYNIKDIDYLKVGHHGSNTSSSYEFLAKMNPKMSIISVGYKNKYGHPHQETITNINRLNLVYKRTDKEGSIYISLN